MDFVEKLWSRVDKNGPCWRYTGQVNRDGYGIVCMSRAEARRAGIGRRWLAHRAAWTMANGPIPGGMNVLHSCDNPPCCNPAHLFLGTQVDNVRDMVEKRRDPRGDRNGARKHPDRVARGRRLPQTKLTETAVADIRRRYVWRTVTARQLAAEYGVCRHTVEKVLKGDTWRHVP